MIEPWQFSSPPARARDPHVVMFVFGVGPLRGDVELHTETYGAPSQASLAACKLQTVSRAQDPAWFDAWRRGSLRSIADQDLGQDLRALDAADHVHVVACEPRGVADLSYLQGVWAIVRYLIAGGATTVLDAMAMTFTPAARVAAADAPLDLEREIRVVFETDSTHSDRAHALHTRGMRKFGAPDLVALCQDDDVPLVGTAIRELASQVACGSDLAVPRHAVEIAPGVRWVAIEDEHRLGELLGLNNEARVLVDETGHHLLGVSRARSSN